MPQFDATIKHIKDGVKGFAITAAVKNIEGWEATLAKIEVSGTKTIIKDLETRNCPGLSAGSNHP